MKYNLIGIDGNAYAEMGYVTNALKNEGLGHLKDEYLKDAKSSDYDHLLAVSIHYIDLANEEALKSFPTEATIEISELDCSINDEDEIIEAAIDFLSDSIGFCIIDAQADLSDEGLVHLTDIEWDLDEEDDWDEED